jgi:hypothetical protein
VLARIQRLLEQVEKNSIEEDDSQENGQNKGDDEEVTPQNN